VRVRSTEERHSKELKIPKHRDNGGEEGAEPETIYEKQNASKGGGRLTPSGTSHAQDKGYERTLCSRACCPWGVALWILGYSGAAATFYSFSSADPSHRPNEVVVTLIHVLPARIAVLDVLEARHGRGGPSYLNGGAGSVNQLASRFPN